MARFNAAYEIHVHGQIALRPEVGLMELQEALRPLWEYAGSHSLEDGAISAYQEEPGIRFDPNDHVLQMCWTVSGDDDFRQILDDLCMNLNEIAATGAAIEVTFYDNEFDDEQPNEDNARDDFMMLFVGPTPADIMQAQRDMLINDVVNMMERHFDAAELGGVVTEIDKLFSARFDDLVNSLDLGKPPRGGGSSGSGHGGGRKPRHLH
jgi:hypothetical protein